MIFEIPVDKFNANSTCSTDAEKEIKRNFTYTSAQKATEEVEKAMEKPVNQQRTRPPSFLPDDKKLCRAISFPIIVLTSRPRSLPPPRLSEFFSKSLLDLGIARQFG